MLPLHLTFDIANTMTAGHCLLLHGRCYSGTPSMLVEKLCEPDYDYLDGFSVIIWPSLFRCHLPKLTAFIAQKQMGSNEN